MCMWREHTFAVVRNAATAHDTSGVTISGSLEAMSTDISRALQLTIVVKLHMVIILLARAMVLLSQPEQTLRTIHHAALSKYQICCR
mmetsp:Transcript_10534/g.22853  ORF Transcript_10534/g.22853 Transcript_10534/m.22853 type:complete len:87 (-) Transcript_10534:866-1126(-)